MYSLQRRDFIKTSLFGGLAAAAMPASAMSAWDAQTKVNLETKSKVSLVKSLKEEDRADMAFRTFQPFAKEIAEAIGKKRVIIKPNFVASSNQLSAIHKDTIEGLLEFLKSIKKLDNCIVTESAADGPTMKAFENYGMLPLAEKYKKYNVKFMDMDTFDPQILWVYDELDFRPHPIRMSSVLLDPDNFRLSAARMKTHDRIVCTLSLKNVIVGAPIKDEGFSFGRDRKPGAKSDKAIMHGNGFKAVNYNLFTTAYQIHPDLSYVEGYTGMEGDGPTNGTQVDHRVSVGSLDWLACDRTCVELMGVDFADLGYLNFCADAGMGQGDLSKIEVVGEKIEDHIIKYKMSRNIEKQLGWKKPADRKAESLY